MILRLFKSTLVICFILIGLTSARADEVRVSIAGSYDHVESFDHNGIDYISLSELANIIGGTVDWKTVGHLVDYSDPGYKFEFLLDAPYFRLNDTSYNMVYDAVLREGQLFVPAVTFLPFLDRVANQRVLWIEDQKIIRIESDYFNVTDLSVQSKANGLLIEIYLAAPVSYDIFVTEGDWLNVSIRDARINRNRILARKNPRFMYALKVHQVQNNTGQISMRLRRKVEKWQHKIAQDPLRIQITIADVNFDMDTIEPVSVGPDDKIDVVVVDAGHGGKDYGAIGPSGTREKDIALSIAKRLANMIRKEKIFKVIMTRDRDETVTLEERARIANEANADLFISIHANASPKRHASGWNVFFLAPALNDSARAVEQLENSVFLRDSFRDSDDEDDEHLSMASTNHIGSIISEMIQTEFHAESNDFAGMISREFRRRLDIPARGVDQAGFFVLNKVFTPSVLVETGFISNRSEERTLKGKKHQEAVARGIYEAIKRFKQRYEN